MSGGQAPYFFLPWLRCGLAASLETDATGARATLDVRLHMRAGNRKLADYPSKQIALYGPGDLLGFDARIVVRTEPRANTGDFEPNYFPFIEFAEPDFPWRFSVLASPSDDATDLIPWISLIVVRVEGSRRKDGSFDESELLREYRDPQSQIPWIEVKSSALPDLNQAGRWAHVQVTDYEPELNEQRLAAMIESNPERLVSRLLCARRLRAGIKYRAYVVPTFALSVEAAASGNAVTGDARTFAWSESDLESGEGGAVQLPYYYKWEFRTGRSGDFEHLVRRLKPRELSELGLRQVDCSHPGYSLEGGPDALGFESALRSADAVPTGWGKDSGAEEEFQTSLANLLEEADGAPSPTGNASADDDPPPRVGPALYGRWYRMSASFNESPDDWFRQLNLDPRHRWAAGLGAEVVRRQQEQLMASAWDQLGDITAVNDLVRRAQFGKEVSTKAEVRLNQLSAGDYLRTAAPVLGLVKAEPVEGVTEEDSVTVEKRILASPIGTAPMDPALRRVARKRGVLRKHQKISRITTTSGEPRAKVIGDLLLRLNLRPPPQDPRVLPLKTPDAKPPLPIRPIVVATKTEPAQGVPSPKRIASSILGKVQESVVSQAPREQSNLAHVASAQTAATPSSTAGTEAPQAEWIADLEKMPASIKARLKPAKTIATRVHGRIERPTAVAPSASADESAGVLADEEPSLAPMKTAPEFPQPMWDALEELSQQYLLAGIDKVPQNTVTLVETNRRFVEAFFCGLNHEFSRELLWREYPTDQRGTYFRQFWDKTEHLPKSEEISDAVSAYKASIGYELWSAEDKRRFAEVYRDQLGDPEGWDDEKVLEEVLKKRAVDEWLKDIPPIVRWNEPLGRNMPASWGWGMPSEEEGRKDDDNLVLLIRGDLLNKYPNAAIYFLKGDLAEEGGRVRLENIERRYPMFAVTAKPDIACIGFDLSAETAIDDGWHLVIEERISENRFGLDISGGASVSDLSWEHFEVADDAYFKGEALGGAAAVASKTMQRPVRVIISAKRMIPPIGRVSGWVETTDARRVMGATVSVGGKSVETAQDGTFALRGVEIGRGQTLSVRHPDYELEEVSVDLTARELTDVRLQLTLLPGRIGGTVTDHRGGGLGGVSISYAESDKTVTSAPSGDYDLTDVPVGKKRVTAELAGYRTETQEVNVVSKERAEVSFALTPTTGTISGTIVDHLGRGLSDARISAGGKETWSTAPTGGYELPSVPVGRHSVSVEKNGFFTQEQSVDVEGGESSSLSFKLIPTTGTIVGKVRGVNNAALSGVKVVVGQRTTTTGTNGQFGLTGVPVGDLTVTLSHRNYFAKTLSVTLAGGETEELNVALASRPGSVQGTVQRIVSVKPLPSLSPLKGAKVTLGSRSTTTDTYGKYQFSDVPAARHSVLAELTGFLTQQRSVDVEGGGSSTVSFTLQPATATITGRVMGAKNAALSGVTVAVAGSKTTTSKNGQFSLTGLPIGKLKVSFSHRSYVTKALSVTLEGGETEELNVALTLLPGSVQGKVKKLSLKGMPSLSAVKGAKVILGYRSTRTDKTGKYRFNNVPAGRHRVSVSYSGCTEVGAPKYAEVLGGRLSEKPVDFTLRCQVPKPTPKPQPRPSPTLKTKLQPRRDNLKRGPK